MAKKKNKAAVPGGGGDDNDKGIAKDVIPSTSAAKEVLVDLAASNLNNTTAGETSKDATSTLQPWAALFKQNDSSEEECLQLKFVDPLGKECKFNDVDGLLDISKSWGPTLVGYVAGRFPGKNAIAHCCQSWGYPCKPSMHANGWLVFRFNNEKDMNEVIEKGPYFIYQRQLILKTIPNFFCFDKEEVCRVPVWVRLPSLPLELWSACALERILSMVGKPLRADKYTSSRQRVSFARALVEVDISKDLTSSIPIILPNGDSFVQEVVYEHVPHFCANCNVIGHKTSSCKAFPSAPIAHQSTNQSGATPTKASNIASAQEFTVHTHAMTKQPPSASQNPPVKKQPQATGVLASSKGKEANSNGKAAANSKGKEEAISSGKGAATFKGKDVASTFVPSVPHKNKFEALAEEEGDDDSDDDSDDTTSDEENKGVEEEVAPKDRDSSIHSASDVEEVAPLPATKPTADDLAEEEEEEENDEEEDEDENEDDEDEDEEEEPAQVPPQSAPRASSRVSSRASQAVDAPPATSHRTQSANATQYYGVDERPQPRLYRHPDCPSISTLYKPRSRKKVVFSNNSMRILH